MRTIKHLISGSLQYQDTVHSTIIFLKLLNVSVCNSTVNEALQNHPDYPSILSISDCLKEWKIENLAIKTNVEKLEKLPTPFITLLQNTSKDYIIATKVNANSITYTNHKDKQGTIAIDTFIRQWNNVVLLAEPNANAGEKDYKRQRRKEIRKQLQIPALFALLVAFGIAAIIKIAAVAGINNSLAFGLLALVKLIGIVTTTLLLWYEVDKSNPLLRQI